MILATGGPYGSARSVRTPGIIAGLSLVILLAVLYLLYPGDIERLATRGLPGVLVIAGAHALAVRRLRRNGGPCDRRVRTAEKGPFAKGGNILNSPPEGSFVIHRFTTGRGTIDHILVGPKGIFTIETKSQRGVVEFDGAALLCDGRPFDEDLLEQARARCALVRELLEKWRIKDPAPEPLIVFTNALVKVEEKTGNVAVVSAARLPKFLEKLPDRRLIPDADRICSWLRAANRMSSSA